MGAPTAEHGMSVVVCDTTDLIMSVGKILCTLLSVDSERIVGHPTSALGLPRRRAAPLERDFQWQPTSTIDIAVDVASSWFTDDATGMTYRYETYRAASTNAGDNKFETVLKTHLEDLADLHTELARGWQQDADARKAERSRVATLLHDDALQQIVVVGWRLDNITTNTAGETRKSLKQLRSEISAIGHELRVLIEDLNPPRLELHGLLTAIHNRSGELLADGTSCHTERTGDGGPIDPYTQTMLYRIGVRALHNVAQHSCATAVTVNLHTDKGTATLTVVDNGIGYRPGSHMRKLGHVGIETTREEARLAGGTFSIGPRGDSRPGTELRVSVPQNSPATQRESWSSPEDPPLF